MINDKNWDWEIGTKPNWSWNFGPLLSYRHLLSNLVRREFLLNYQQTILGPLWILFQPILTLITYILVFNKIIGIPIGGNLPPVLFYFSGIVLWGFFNESFGGISNTFINNIHIFSKVYFPRIIMPLSLMITQFLRLCIQLILLILLIIYYTTFQGFNIRFNELLFAVPVAVLFVGIISLSIGLILSVLTAKYRDIGNFVTVGIRLLMFITPVIYPLSAVKGNLHWIVNLNPLTPLFELFRLGLLGSGTVNFSQFLYSALFASLAMIAALYLFKKEGSKLIDVV